MLSIAWFCDVIPSLIYAWIIFRVLKVFLPTRFSAWPVSVVEILALLFVGNAIIYPEEVTGTLGSLLILMLLLLVFHRGDWYMKITAVLIVYPAMTAISFLCQDLGQMIWMYGFQKQMSAAGENMLYLLTRFLRVPVWFVILRYVRSWVPKAVQIMTARMWLVLDVISLASFTGIIIIIYKCTARDSYLAWPACLASLVTSLGCCYLCTYMAKIVRTDMELQSARYQQSYYEEMERNQQNVRRLRHDMRNHLNVIGTLLKTGGYKEAQSYLNGLDGEFVSSIREYCPNAIVNAVLNAKCQEAEEQDICCEYQVDLNKRPDMEDIDLCSLLANTLDNAIEACVKIPGGRKDRKITLKARCTESHFSYEIINTKRNQVAVKDGKFETDKSDRTAHGIGMRSVRGIVEKYGGVIEISYTEDQFSVVVLI